MQIREEVFFWYYGVMDANCSDGMTFTPLQRGGLVGNGSPWQKCGTPPYAGTIRRAIMSHKDR